MRKIKITVAAIALVLTVGLTSASFAIEKARLNDCSSSPTGSPLDRDSSLCDGAATETCCYRPNGTPIPEEYPNP